VRKPRCVKRRGKKKKVEKGADGFDKGGREEEAKGVLLEERTSQRGGHKGEKKVDQCGS